MSTNLRAGFKERHRKRLHKAIDVVRPPAKRVCPERVQEKLGRKVLPMPVPPSDTTGPSSVPATKKKANPTLVRPLMVLLPSRRFWIKKILLRPLLL